LSKQYFLLLFVLCLIAFSSCSREDIARDLSQSDALEIVAVLSDENIPAKVIKNHGSSKLKYQVSVSSSDYAKAASVLHSRQLPRVNELDELLAQSAIMPNSSNLETLRTDRALSLQLEEHLRNLPGVKNSQAIVRTIDRNSTAESAYPGNNEIDKNIKSKLGVSVILYLVKSNNSSTKVTFDEVYSHLKSIFPNVSKNEISISLVDATDGKTTSSDSLLASKSHMEEWSNFLWYAKVSPDYYWKAAFIFLFLLILVALSGGVVGFWIAAVAPPVKRVKRSALVPTITDQ
jgi:type III secretory pathway lipoprotein EscJ